MVGREFKIEEAISSNGLCMLKVSDQFNNFYGGIGNIFNFTTQSCLESATNFKETIENAYQKGLLGVEEDSFDIKTENLPKHISKMTLIGTTSGETYAESYKKGWLSSIFNGAQKQKLEDTIKFVEFAFKTGQYDRAVALKLR